MDENTYLPQHIAIIMDGNRRWARERGLNVSDGHKRGAEVLENIARYCNNIGIKHLTVYAFSTENWKRAKEEVGALMNLLRFYLDKFSKQADTENMKIKVIGDVTALDKGIQKSIANAIERTKNNTGLTFNIALNYGGRAEIIKAIKEVAQDVKDGILNIENISEEVVNSKLYTAGQPDPDLLIRTSGEIRTSNFLPWQLVYSEFYFVQKYWPDFNNDDVDEAIKVYQKRNRKFGGK
ncbi:MAG: isoprenyl transferase [Clostridia bacterium]|nr:isoprenyl transferase [Clostridia bacterium]